MVRFLVLKNDGKLKEGEIYEYDGKNYNSVY